MSDALFAVQQAVVDILAASTEVQSVIGYPARLYDHVPPGAAFPYVVYGPVHVAPFDTKTETGFEQIITLDIWSRYRGGKEISDIFQALYDTLHRAVLTVAGQVYLSCEFHGADLAMENDGLTYHASVRFLVLTQSS
ncbi:MAG: DUF3168 domain-containing protein [Alphaproteobacteria bacterium]|nr:DUF3168 domain-containing protein [Alphaproteobacteria bacterium]